MYDPSFFMERELYLQNVRRQIEEKDDCCEGWKDVLYEMTEFYEDYLNAYRAYEDCYDPDEKQELAQRMEESVSLFNEALDYAEECAK